MAKEEKKKDKKAKKADKPGKNAVSYSVSSKDTVPTYRDGDVSFDNGIFTITYKKPRSAKFATVKIHANNVFGAAIGTKEEGGYVITDHPNIAATAIPTVNLSALESEGDFITGTDVNGLKTYVNTRALSIATEEIEA